MNRFELLNLLQPTIENELVICNIGLPSQELYKIMQSGGMSKEVFNQCIKNIDLENEILQGVMNAQSEFNIKSTPSFLINGILLEGNKPIKDFRQIIDKILSE